eukprot:CAMPEP_0118633212 /NCGR_PEP_ID=MMETSP0785-20121206/872_1 /TAXON_ID=91992 /ORGANISM="Bolidomonas pacifica, Strain CCMP 1866" /LENGTH=57 /DNA_ID=CAMNT_0006524063 /DNA_START=217 /DNA_END=387 /DNA_ORIENTATION=+
MSGMTSGWKSEFSKRLACAIRENEDNFVASGNVVSSSMNGRSAKIDWKECYVKLCYD